MGDSIMTRIYALKQNVNPKASVSFCSTATHISMQLPDSGESVYFNVRLINSSYNFKDLLVLTSGNLFFRFLSPTYSTRQVVC